MQKYNQGQQLHIYKVKGKYREQEGAGGKYTMNDCNRREESSIALQCHGPQKRKYSWKIMAMMTQTLIYSTQSCTQRNLTHYLPETSPSLSSHPRLILPNVP